MAKTDNWFLDLQLSKVNWNGLLNKCSCNKFFSIFWLFLPKTNNQESHLKIYRRLTDLYQTELKHEK